MPPKKKTKKLVQITLGSNPVTGANLGDIPTRMAAIGNYYGDAPRDYANDEPRRITRENVATLGGGTVVLKDLEVQISDLGQKKTVRVPELALNKGTTDWPVLIAQQVPEIRLKVALRDAIREARRNPTRLQELKAWLRSDPAARAVVERVMKARADGFAN